MTLPVAAGALVRWGAGKLSASPTAMLDARTLFLFVSGWDHTQLIGCDERCLGEEVAARFSELIVRRAEGEPVAYITGRQEFFGRTFKVTSDVLIPRPETEMLVEAARGLSPARVVDFGVGSGCLLGSVLAECPNAIGEGWDISAAALAVARSNLEEIGVADRAELIERSFEESVNRQFDLIISNPPYIEATAELPVSVRRYEPAVALFAGADGLDAYRALAPSLSVMLTADGTALLEIGTGQGDAVTAIMKTALPRRDVLVHEDLAGHQRMVEIGPEG